MGFARACLVLLTLALAALAAVPPAAADPTVCGPWSGNEAVKSHTCVDPQGAPSCPVYIEYFTGLHHEVACFGVPAPGPIDPNDPLAVVPDIWPRCIVPSTYGAQAWICVDPDNEECTVSRQTYLLGEYSPEDCTADPRQLADVIVPGVYVPPTPVPLPTLPLP